MKSIKEWQKEIHQNAVNKGFYDGELIKDIPLELNLMKWIGLMICELTEAMEAIRKRIPWNHKHGIAEEFADTVIRIMDTCEYLDINLEKAILKKYEENMDRPHRHGKKF